jgi:hypothetical protein
MFEIARENAPLWLRVLGFLATDESIEMAEAIIVVAANLVDPSR